MNKLSILLLIYLLSVGNVNAAMAEPSDVSFGPSDPSNTSETDAFPPTFWIVGLGLCLVFLGYKIKTKPK
jgi:hypothetical protein